MPRTILWIIVISCRRVRLGLSPLAQKSSMVKPLFAGTVGGACHNSGGAPNLLNVTRRYEKEKLKRFILDPDKVYRERCMRPLNPGYSRMPKPGVTSLTPTSSSPISIR